MTNDYVKGPQSGADVTIPGPVAAIAAVMAGYERPWALCGGWAVDAWLGRETRDHGDLDVSVFHEDQAAIHTHLAGWQLLAHDRNWSEGAELWDGSALELPAHIHCRSAKDAGALPADGIARTEDGFWLELCIDELSGEHWVLRRDPRIAVDAAAAVGESAWGLPTVVPEVLLFFKATAYIGIAKLENRPQDNADFEALLPTLSAERRQWLKDAISSVQAGHRWLAKFEA